MEKSRKALNNEVSLELETEVLCEPCRACLINNKRKDQYVSLTTSTSLTLTSTQSPSLINMFYFCTNIHIEQDDNFTKNICLDCLDLLEKLYRFKIQCAESDNVLRTLQEKLQTEDNKIHEIIKQEEVKVEYANIEVKEEEDYEDMDIDLFDDYYHDDEPEFNDHMKLRNKKSIKFQPTKTKVKKEKKQKEENDEDYDPGIKQKSITGKRNIFKPKVIHNCPKCELTFKSKKWFESHKAKHVFNELGYYPCDMCDEKFKEMGSVRRHKRRFHLKPPPTIEELTCKYCQKIFTKLILLKKHIAQHKDEDDEDYIPGINQRSITGKRNIFKPKVIHNCPKCELTFKSKKWFESHKAKHVFNELGHYPCDMCDEKFKEMGAVWKHKTHFHVKPPPTIEELTCKYCKKIFTKLIFLEKHIAHHKDDKMVCPICGYANTRKNLHYHMKKHTKIIINENLECKICHKMCKTKAVLNWHWRRHHIKRERKFACEFCDAKFFDDRGLKNHKTIHTGIGKAECHICNKKFWGNNYLKVHMRIHTGERPFICEVCTMPCITKERLREHMRIHTGEKPFVCDICNHAFSQQGTMKRHRKTHDNNILSKQKISDISSYQQL